MCERFWWESARASILRNRLERPLHDPSLTESKWLKASEKSCDSHARRGGLLYAISLIRRESRFAIWKRLKLMITGGCRAGYLIAVLSALMQSSSAMTSTTRSRIMRERCASAASPTTKDQ